MTVVALVFFTVAVCIGVYAVARYGTVDVCRFDFAKAELVEAKRELALVTKQRDAMARSLKAITKTPVALPNEPAFMIAATTLLTAGEYQNLPEPVIQ
jgi:hypothetical protein